jgi:hypothetical protein
MNTLVKVARFNLVRPAYYLLLPWILPLAFALAATTARRDHEATGYLLSFFIFFGVQGWQTVSRSLPFGLALGASRRSFYSGTALLGMALALGCGLLLTALQAIERATGGWGERMHFFQIPYILDGPWYLTGLTSFVALALLFVWGMWFGIVHRRWNLFGSVTFIAAQVIVVVAAVLILVWADAWLRVGHFFTGLTAVGFTGVLAALALLLLAGGQATIRRASV